MKSLETMNGIQLVRTSPIYKTNPVGGISQPRFANAAALITTVLPAARLLKVLKSLERDAGRRVGVRWGPRPLDIDIVDYGGAVLGWPGPARRVRGGLVLPHPEAHRRGFVLRPLADVAPGWRHPAIGVAVKRLIARLPADQRRPGAVVRLDSGG
jgi:2-amino-4-hydroxy-6-hydroxymethyldihydropteridine diphosphokinase